MTSSSEATVHRANDPWAQRVVVLTPLGRDAEMVRERVVADGMMCEVCADLQAVLPGISSGVGAIVIAEEALSRGGAEALLAALEAQEPWSDVPVLLLLAAARSRWPSRAANVKPAPGLFERANVTLLQRPLSTELFSSSVRAAVRARRRQYQMLGLYRDLERAIQLSDMFVGILGHDLRNPLGAIKMSAEIIVRSTPDVHALRPAGRILTSADRMTRMIEQILDYARARQETGIPLDVNAMDLGQLCRQALQEIEDANPDTSLELKELGNVSGFWDADRLAQVVTNLVGNAVKHGMGGKPITIEVDGTDASVVRLAVHNAGSIPPEAIPTLFEAFGQAGRSTPRSGLGLGLFIAREIARSHGGDISVRSSDDRTTFEVTLPREARPIGARAVSASAGFST